jgi:DNA-binding winged helix-turn-helix (wHTH) protein
MSGKKVRFAQFELDFGRFQLFRSGEPVRLEGLPLQLLMYLIDHHRELVTREQIAATLWGRDIFVDVELGINTAVRKVRMALEDDSAQPKYLQTVVGHGYRFIAELSGTEETSTSSDSGKVSLEELGQRSWLRPVYALKNRRLLRRLHENPRSFPHSRDQLSRLTQVFCGPRSS